MNSLSYRRKNQLLLALSGILLLLVLGVSVRKTVSLVQVNADLQQQLEQATGAPQRIAQLEQRSTQLGSVMAMGTAESALRRELFEKIGAYCQQHQLQLHSFQEAETFIEEHLEVETHELILEGSFQAQVRVCQALESSLQQGRVTSIVFNTIYDRREKQTYLQGQFFIQGIKEITNDKNR
ncbi:hypothetical protein [Tunicatimonas pelagia]|uniref:hypothetical protein n=1 Tax=Tunicatimonas pelagia TaxID=931531 RepID=UPI00266698BB|nr:hypothetical protein [Tunicatimonas pelagia]WKN45343.1 hypothetical protein P0M28_10265 [Tunicatimonas pelagia]